MFRILTLCTAIVVTTAGCGEPSGGGPPSGAHIDCSTPTDGVLSLAWTVRGQPPSAGSCLDIDHLEVTIAPDLCNGVVTVAPVTCSLDRWRFDELPEGGATIYVDAIGTDGIPELEGETRLTIGPTIPETPQTLDLR